MRFIVLFFILILVIVTLTSTKVQASHQFGTEGRYCEDNSVWHDIPGNKTGTTYGHVVEEDCGANEDCRPKPPQTGYFEDAFCKQKDNNATTPKGDGTHLTVDPAPPNGVEQTKQFQFHLAADQACYDIIGNNDQNTGKDSTNFTHFNFHATGRLDSCKITNYQCGCTTKAVPHMVDDHDDPDNPGKVTGHHQEGFDHPNCGPADWHIPVVKVDPENGQQLGFNTVDDKKCIIDFTCNASAVQGEYNAPLITGTPACDNNVFYKIIPFQQDIPQTDCKEPSKQQISSTVNDAFNIRIPSMLEDQKTMTRVCNNLLPQEICHGYDSLKAPQVLKNPPITGIDPTILTSIICTEKVRGIPILGGIASFLFCPVGVLVPNEATEQTAKLALAMRNAQAPKEAKDTPRQRECTRNDFTNPQNGQTTTGGEAIKQTAAGLADKNGIYYMDQPKMDDTKMNPDRTKSWVLSGRVADQDDQTLYIREMCKRKGKSIFPANVNLCNP